MTSPLEEFNKSIAERWEILSDIPEWERDSIYSWLYKVFNRMGRDVFGATITTFQPDIAREIEKKYRLILAKDLKIHSDDWSEIGESFLHLIKNDTFKAVLFLELVVKYLRDHTNNNLSFGSKIISKGSILNYLQNSLDNGSKWSIVFDKSADAGFVERVDPNITNIAKDLRNNELDIAWNLAYQPEPKPEKAIEHAQSALESLASEYDLTKATSSVFGTLLGDIKTHKSTSYVSVAKPAFDLSNQLAGTKSKEIDVNDQFTDWFYTGMNLIQKSNPAHHKSTATSHFKVTPDTAKQAVLISTILCYMITQKYIYKSSNGVK